MPTDSGARVFLATGPTDLRKSIDTLAILEARLINIDETQALAYIQQLYGLEKEARTQGMPPEAIKEMRAEKARPILDAFHQWLLKRSVQTPPKGLLGKAITYALHQWDRLLVYLEDGIITPDNNMAEKAIRPFVLGRKNWLFAGSPRGGRGQRPALQPDRNRQSQRL